ncbi:MAG TPA: TonB-dependent receptor [Ramlibacter sp.]|nr:TonB-dependent receptor [Ramlibacter sp.]
MNPPALFVRATFALALACLCGAVRAQGTQLEPVTVQGNYENTVGTSNAASEGVVTSKLIEARPTLRPAEVLEFVPGVIVTQHSGDGKANQYFLRGFNLDHGTDFATWVDGMPVNMVTHAHGQGYSDLNWLLPELVDRIAYRKGPYYAEEGDFSSAGAAHIRLFDRLPANVAEASLGENGYRRALVAGNAGIATGNLVYAIEGAANEGPWLNPERFRRTNALLRYSQGNAGGRYSITAMAYSARWNATDPVPQRAVDAGTLDRFGTVDPSDGGTTSRYSLSWEMQNRTNDGGEWRANAYAVRSQLALYSNFTYFLDDPVRGDQFSQAEHRTLFGGTLSRRWNTSLGGHEGRTTIGVQLREDRLDPIGLYTTQARERLATVEETRVNESSVGVFIQNDTQWTPWLRAVTGVRGDHFHFLAQGASIASPKLSLVFGPWARTEYFANWGWGFHSNDARALTDTPLVRSKGLEFGARTEIIPGVQSSIALWQLRLASELVFAGDAGVTQASRSSKRSGIEWNNHWRATPWLLIDADFSASRARFTQDDPAGNFVPGSVGKVVSLGATVTDWGPWFGQFQLRYFGPRPLTEDDSRRSKATTLASLRIGYKFTPRVKIALDVFNLFDRKASDIDYYYVSRLAGEPPTGVADTHFHPVEPRSVRLTLTANY